MPSIQQKYQQLVEKLWTRTEADDLSWSIDDWKDPFTMVGSRRVSLEYTEDEQEKPFINVKIADREGTVIERFHDEQLSGAPEVGSFSSYYLLMSALRDNAIRKANGVDQAIDEILSQL